MTLPPFGPDGYLPPGIHAASLHDVAARFGVGSEERERQMRLLRLVTEAGQLYPTIKRVLVWGSFVSSKPAPNDLDYSLVVSIGHAATRIAEEHQRFYVPAIARQFYGVDRDFLVIKDYPLGLYIERLDFMCHSRALVPVEIVEISLWGEYGGIP